MNIILNDKEIELLKICGKILSKSLDEVIRSIKPGITGDTLDRIAEESIRMQGATPSFLNYGDDDNPFPSTICLSINNEIVHGIPLKSKVLCEGDIVSIDIGAEYKGIFTDMAKTVIAGKAKSPEDIKLIKTTSESLERGIKKAIKGNYTGDIGYEIQRFVESNGFSVVKTLVGHGIGHRPHQDPQVPNFGYPNKGFCLINNIAIAIEPMVNIGSSDVIVDKDGWTVKTFDGTKSAHFEHTVLITNKNPIVVTS